MSKQSERIQELLKISEDFSVAELTPKNKPGTWIKITDIKKPINNFPFRQQLPNEIIIELDLPTPEENKKMYTQIKGKLTEKGIAFEGWDPQSKSIHVNIFFNKSLKDVERLAFLKNILTREELKACDKNYWTKKGRQLIATGGAIHYKSKKPKVLLEKIGEGLNEFPKLKLDKSIEKRPDERKITVTPSIILHNTKATEQERVSCVMQLLALFRFKNPNKTKEEYADFVFREIDVNNRWEHYKPKLTSQKVTQVINTYFEKENPVKHEDKTIKQPPNKIVLKNYLYFDKLKKDKRYLVQNFLYPATINALWSPPGNLKSFLAIHAGIQIATGKPFLGMKTHKYPCLIMDNENHEQEIKRRLTAMRRGHNIRSKKFPLHYITNSGALFDSREKVAELFNIIKEKKIKFCVIDTLHRFSDYEENSADAINKLYRNILNPITELDCAILYLHHTGKDGRYRGSVDLLGCVDSAYTMKKIGNTGKFQIACEKSRFGEEQKISGLIDFGEDAIRVMRLDEIEQDKEEKGKFMEVVSKIGELFSIKGSSWKTCDIYSEFKLLQDKGTIDTSKTTIKNAISWMYRKDYLDKTKRGEYTRKWEGMFSL